MFFIEHLCELAKREGHQEYISNIERDMSKIINLVAPGTKAGAMNIKVVRKVWLLFLSTLSACGWAVVQMLMWVI
jgi:hypothetical protein